MAIPYKINHIGLLSMKESFELALKFKFDLEEIVLEELFLFEEERGERKLNLMNLLL